MKTGSGRKAEEKAADKIKQAQADAQADNKKKKGDANNRRDKKEENMEADQMPKGDDNQETAKKEEKQRYAFFVGCTTALKIPFVERLARELFSILDIELIDLDFSCCPTSRIVKDMDRDLWLVIAARNLALAEKEKLPILSMCTGCTQTLKEAAAELSSKETRENINEMLPEGLRYEGKSEIVFYSQCLYDNKGRIRQKVKKPLSLDIATHPGCHILRPSSILGFDDPENPTKMDEILKACGAEPVDFKNKTLCCGFPIYDVDAEAAKDIMAEKLRGLRADCMAVQCPTCFTYYELRQKAIAEEMGFAALPVLHLIQLVAFAMGIDDVGCELMHNKAPTVWEKLAREQQKKIFK